MHLNDIKRPENILCEPHMMRSPYKRFIDYHKSLWSDQGRLDEIGVLGQTAKPASYENHCLAFARFPKTLEKLVRLRDPMQSSARRRLQTLCIPKGSPQRCEL
jgi:hypothetical protein